MVATTRLIPMHKRKGKTVAKTYKDIIDYALNPDKTEDGKYISSFDCDTNTASSEFLLTRKAYSNTTGRIQDEKKEILAYQIRQAFKPDEITPEQANKIGYELAKKLTKGNYQFIVATHVDRNHIHNHILFHSVSNEYNRKFRNFWGSSFAIQKISDLLCLENQLSVIEKSSDKSCVSYNNWSGYKVRESWQERLKQAVDFILNENPRSFDEFLIGMNNSGYEYKTGKHLGFRATKQGQKKFTRLRSLGEEYSEETIRNKIECSSKEFIFSKKKKESNSINLLVDIQKKIQEGKSKGYEQWAKIYNLKQMAKTLSFLSENGLLEYSQLEKISVDSSNQFNEILKQIKNCEKRLKEVQSLKTNIINYAKYRNIFTDYKKSGYNKKFYNEHESELIIFNTARKAFDNLNIKTLPSVKSLNEELLKLNMEKKNLYIKYKEEKTKMTEIMIAKSNVDLILKEEVKVQNKQKEMIK